MINRRSRRILAAVGPMLLVGLLAFICRALYEAAMFGWKLFWPAYQWLVRWVDLPATHPTQEADK